MRFSYQEFLLVRTTGRTAAYSGYFNGVSKFDSLRILNPKSNPMVSYGAGDDGEGAHQSLQREDNWQRSVGVTLLVGLSLCLAMVCAASLMEGEGRPVALLTGGGFLGDLPKGGEHGNDKVRHLKELASGGIKGLTKEIEGESLAYLIQHPKFNRNLPLL